MCLAAVLALLTGCGRSESEAESSTAEEATAQVQEEKADKHPAPPPAEPAEEPEQEEEEDDESAEAPFAAENVAGASARENHTAIIKKKSATITVDYTLVQKDDGLAVEWHMTGAKEKSGTSNVTDYDPETGTGTVAMPSGNFPFAVTGEPGSMTLHIDH